MSNVTNKTKGILKWPLVLAAIIVVLRVVLERTGAPAAVSNLASVVMLYLVIGPLYFANRLVKSGEARPYRALFKFVAAYALLARLMVIPTYWLAYIYQWPEARFSAGNGGVVGPEITPVMAYLVVPFGALIAWVIGSLLIGGGLGSALIALKRRSAR